MKIKFLILIPFIIAISFYCSINIIHERKIDALSNLSPEKIMLLLGSPRSISKGSYEESRSGNEFKKYIINNNFRSHDVSVCKSPVTQLHFKGHTCLMFCPFLFEDNITVVLDESGKVCKVERYGL